VNEVLPKVWIEQLVRLQLGIAPADALGSPRRLVTVEVFSENVPRPHSIAPWRGLAPDPSIGLPRLRRTPSARYSIVFGSSASRTGRVVVRIVDRFGEFVPRRLSIPVHNLVRILSNERAVERNPSTPRLSRACRPLLYPSMRYGMPAGATVVRGRAVFGASRKLAQWTRVRANPAGRTSPTWYGHGDSNGEFVMFVDQVPAANAKELTDTLGLDVTVFARPIPPDAAPADSPSQSRDDPLWLLPIEVVPRRPTTDDVMSGIRTPPGYTARTTQRVTCRRGGFTPLQQFVL
jgi:hypothetical protein